MKQVLTSRLHLPRLSFSAPSGHATVSAPLSASLKFSKPLDPEPRLRPLFAALPSSHVKAHSLHDGHPREGCSARLCVCGHHEEKQSLPRCCRSGALRTWLLLFPTSLGSAGCMQQSSSEIRNGGDASRDLAAADRANYDDDRRRSSRARRLSNDNGRPWHGLPASTNTANRGSDERGGQAMRRRGATEQDQASRAQPSPWRSKDARRGYWREACGDGLCANDATVGYNPSFGDFPQSYGHGHTPYNWQE